jgi:hypothetical protein
MTPDGERLHHLQAQYLGLAADQSEGYRRV